MDFKSTRLAIIALAMLSTTQAQYPQYGPPTIPYFQTPNPLTSSSSSLSCVNHLFPCLNYLNTTSGPPRSCCDPLKDVIKSDKECLCQIISTQASFQAQLVGINISQVEMLPERCGLRANPLACLKDETRNSVQNAGGAGSFSGLTTILSECLFIVITEL